MSTDHHACHSLSQVFPAFTYDSRTGNLVDETLVTRQAFTGMLVGVAWGIAVAIFVEPLGVGVVSEPLMLKSKRTNKAHLDMLAEAEATSAAQKQAR